MAQVTEQEFFGGAIRGVVPQGWIDASTLREIPDHQELFLSPATLSNLIIEINQRVSQDNALGIFATYSHQHPTLAAGGGSASNVTSETVDKAAALYHLHDLCDEGDAMQVVTPPTRVTLTRLSDSASPGSPVTAYKGVVTFSSPSRQRGGHFPGSSNGIPTAAADSAVAGATVNGTSGQAMSKMTCHYLLMRLEAQDTDLLAFFNVPHEEFDRSGNPRGLSREEAIAEETIGGLANQLEIRDWGLFV
ncbi:hypothetical protein N7462_007946 [Penicillium macrosclerotiorum]|uniref:uncharacterized protein n=1 Tax=Penicillium macrosclerotiorum TaxID=303699 RepID=UPI002546E62A|nr:uncharacterized protein N7462_007946 [Penicillium macrosclerotiorum]KAJ5679702.1 hypothetical protein N7462_007946 [Penicillium macrosclerotiorum]